MIKRFDQNTDGNDETIVWSADGLTAYTIQCHVIGFVVGVIVTGIVGWLVFW